MLLGCIGDDFTGSSDLGAMLRRGGMRADVYCGIPSTNALPNAEAGIVALKSRTCPVDVAVRDSLDALDWLIRQGCQQIFFKYCSTFDSTPSGNIGPVIDALMDALDTDRTIVCPAFPATGRRVFHGHLFVHDRLLNECGMQAHPLTPMTDPDIRRWLQRQARRGVGSVLLGDVQGDDLSAALEREVADGRSLIVADALEEPDLLSIGAAAKQFKLITGGSGVALGLPANFPEIASRAGSAPSWTGIAGPAVALSGSCSQMTQAQVRAYAESHPALRVDPAAVLAGDQTAETVADWLAGRIDETPLAYSTDAPDAVSSAQGGHGREAVADALERLFAQVAADLAERGVRRFIVAGGETSGAVVQALGLERLTIGPDIAPGVPAMTEDAQDIAVALKSGNFGDEDFFAKAEAVLRSNA